MPFFSIPGMRFDNTRERKLTLPEIDPDDPRVAEYKASRSETSHKTSGFDVGDQYLFRGDVCEVLHEEHDAHSGEVRVTVRRSVRGDSGTHEIVMAPGDDPRDMVIARTRRSFF